MVLDTVLAVVAPLVPIVRSLLGEYGARRAEAEERLENERREAEARVIAERAARRIAREHARDRKAAEKKHETTMQTVRFAIAAATGLAALGMITSAGLAVYTVKQSTRH